MQDGQKSIPRGTARPFEEIEVDKLTRKKWAQQSDDYDSHLGIRREKPLQIAFPDKIASKGPY
jgi:hypothetical protein